MPTKVTMPQLGESVVEGTVSRWLKQPGDAVREYDPLLEVSTDKVDTEVPAPADGVLLAIHVAEGETVAAGALLAVIGQPGEETTADLLEAREPVVETAPAGRRARAEVAANGGGAYTGHITPVVARMAAEHQIDLADIAGTGRGGRVTKKDVEAYLETRNAAAAAPWETPGSGDLFKSTVDYEATPAPLPADTPRRAHPVEAIPAGAPGELVGLSTMRRTIAGHMVMSKRAAPHVTTVFELDMSAVLKHRAAHKAEFARQGVNLTLTAYFVAAAGSALRQHPYLNAQWTDEGIYLHHQTHIGIAVALDNGLIVPVIKNAQELNLMGLARAVNDLATRARSKQLQPDEVQGGTFSITNHGVSGSLFATPIINQPQAAILGVGALEDRVKVINGMMAIRPCLYAALTFDHRVVDGAAADAFMLTLKEMLESWS